MKTITSFAIAFSMAIAVGSSANAADWATLKGQFLFGAEGVELPAKSKLSITKDTEVCGKNDLFNESLIVNEKNRGISNVVLWAYKPKLVHESYKESEEATVEIINKDCRFEPHAVAVRTGQTLRVGNPDAVGHNSLISFLKNPGVNPIIPASGKVEFNLKKAEIIPVKVSCSIHPWMQGIVLVQDHPYMAITDADGKFELKNLPAGPLTIKVWHEKVGYVSTASIDGKDAKWSKGKYKLELAGGKEEEHTYTLDPKKFDK